MMTNKEKFKALQSLEEMKYAYHKERFDQMITLSDETDHRLNKLENAIRIGKFISRIVKIFKK